MATITRYENFQVQDRAHDNILRKIDSDPAWFIEMLERAKGKIVKYTIHRQTAVELLNKKTHPYVNITVNANYSYHTMKISPDNSFYQNPNYNTNAICERVYKAEAEIPPLIVNAA